MFYSVCCCFLYYMQYQKGINKNIQQTEKRKNKRKTLGDNFLCVLYPTKKNKFHENDIIAVIISYSTIFIVSFLLFSFSLSCLCFFCCCYLLFIVIIKFSRVFFVLKSVDFLFSSIFFFLFYECCMDDFLTPKIG